jgi:23S rRNA (cytosine1962-C5)-methyltransferase
MSRDKEVLDLFCYTGGFSISSLAGGAKSVVAVDNSAPSLEILRRNMELNHIKPFAWNCVKEDASSFLRENKNTYDVVVCDPPPFEKEFESYLAITSLAMARVRKGGLLFSTVSYSPKFLEVDLIKILSIASSGLSRSARIIGSLFQSPDHPFLASHPEGKHMHGFIVHVE